VSKEASFIFAVVNCTYTS